MQPLKLHPMMSFSRTIYYAYIQLAALISQLFLPRFHLLIPSCNCILSYPSMRYQPTRTFHAEP